MRQAFGGSVGAMRDRESVVDIDVAQLRECGGEVLVVFLFAGVIAKFSSMAIWPGATVATSASAAGPTQSSPKRTGAPAARTACRRRASTNIWPPACRPAPQMRKDDNLRAAGDEIAECGQKPFDAGGVGDLAGHGDVKIGADKHRFPETSTFAMFPREPSKSAVIIPPMAAIRSPAHSCIGPLGAEYATSLCIGADAHSLHTQESHCGLVTPPNLTLPHALYKHEIFYVAFTQFASIHV